MEQALSGRNIDVLYFHENIDKIVEDIKWRLGALKEKESERICKMFITKPVNENTLANLAKLLVVLFGRAQAEKEYIKFVRQRQVNALPLRNLQYTSHT